MKIIFAAYYFYFQKELYSLIINELKNDSSDFRFLATHSHYGRKETLVGTKKINLKGEIFEDATCTKIERIILGIKKAGYYFYDRLTLFRLLKNWLPNVVIINNDLAGIYIRMLQDLCSKLEIPILLIITTNFVTFEVQPQAERVGIRWVYGQLLKRLECYDAYYFNGNTIGTYIDSSMIAVQGDYIKNILIEKGVSHERIVVTGNPLFDKYFALREIQRAEALAIIKKRNKIDINSKQQLVVYCTEVIEYVYGQDYLEEANHVLKGIFDSLGENVKIIVKLHPAENKENVKYYRELFNSDRYSVIEDTDLGNLFRASSLMIAHFSATIMEAISVGTPVLMIDFNKDTERHQYIPYNEKVVAQSDVEFKGKLDKLLNEKEYIDEAMIILDKWVLSYLDNSHSVTSTSRVVELIKKMSRQHN
ncbi:UDP-N-acetylglucosamine 2-epimerase [Pelosinus fermentans]|uniref:UDP-N-acetylglucosamine 2-epimerase n=1 Tax=Pelosinus fermentans TaxID=365349 RepID=UPI0002685D9B|nr:UDP-N-acetylglucosamine 2-epimerase [Pelosinus fermentans]OAM92788.1 UDP-N-acetylglucosamine 2-epimerase [Pelosinus fermentans DSM 17108]SDQ56876.1 UDP-N-acetylglucosamine 2-epimerase [Pelosinus fermentans]